MKKILFLFAIAAMVMSCKPKEAKFVIHGKISGADSTTYYLQKRVPGKYVKLDSAMVLKGEMKITGKVDYPEMVYLFSKDMRSGISFFIENSEITITGAADSLFKGKVTGSKTQSEFDSLQASLKPVSKKMQELYKLQSEATAANKKESSDSIDKVMTDLEKEATSLEKEFIKNHPASYVTPTILRGLSYEMEPAEIETMIAALDTSVAKTQIIKDLSDRVKIMKTVSVGQKAPDFTLNDPEDKPVSLYSKIGKSKLLLVDFWASWCGPCRAENPNVVKVWTQFHKAGFDAFGVSLDKPGTKDKWVEAIKNDKLTWTHVSDLKYWDCTAAKLYAVNAIPANFLLDENGVIIGRNLRGDDLYNKVKEILGKLK